MLSLICSAHPGGRWHKLQLTQFPSFKGFWVWGRALAQNWVTEARTRWLDQPPSGLPRFHLCHGGPSPASGSLQCAAPARPQARAGLAPISVGRDSAGAHLRPPAHQPAPEGSHHSSPGMQRPREKVAPLQASAVTGPQTEGKVRPIPIRRASHGKRVPFGREHTGPARTP